MTSGPPAGRQSRSTGIFWSGSTVPPKNTRWPGPLPTCRNPSCAGAPSPRAYSLYIGIPFCPSRCSYCSFVSCNLDRDRKLVQPYVDCLCRELEAIRAQADQAGLHLQTIYIGGGTPTSLSAGQLRQLMGAVRDSLSLEGLAEYTVEAGRPDCTDAEKLAVIKEYGATRISINPQTFSDQVLANIGRRHTARISWTATRPPGQWGTPTSI